MLKMNEETKAMIDNSMSELHDIKRLILTDTKRKILDDLYEKKIISPEEYKAEMLILAKPMAFASLSKHYK